MNISRHVRALLGSALFSRNLPQLIMAVRVAIVVCATSFLLGILFTHWVADSLTLWKAAQLEGADARLWTAASYYRVLMSGDPRNAYVALGVATLGAVSLVMSLTDGKAFNLMFDGGSTCTYAFSYNLDNN